MTKRVTTPEMRERIASLREQNWTVEAIAAEFKISIGAVQHWLLIMAVEAPKRPPRTTRRGESYTRGARVVHPFSPDEDAFIQDLDERGFNYSAIARALTERNPGRPRNPTTIKYRFMTLARQQERAESAA